MYWDGIKLPKCGGKKGSTHHPKHKLIFKDGGGSVIVSYSCVDLKPNCLQSSMFQYLLRGLYINHKPKN